MRLFWLSCLALAGSAQAAAVAGPGGTAEQGRRLVQAAPVAGADAPTLDLVAARIEAVDAEGRSITVAGRPVPLHPQQLRVLGTAGGAATGPHALQPGMQVRFALEPLLRGGAGSAQATSAPVRRIVLIMIDRQP